MNRELLETMTWLPLVSAALGFTMGCYYFRSLNFKGKLLLSYLFLAFVFDFISRAKLIQINFILLPIFSFLEVLLFSLLFQRIITSKSKFMLKVIGIIILMYILKDIWDVSFQNAKSFFSMSKIIGPFFIMILSLATLIQSLNHRILTEWEIKLSLGTLVFFTMNGLWFLTANFFINTFENDTIYYFWAFSFLITSLYYSFITYLLWKNGNKSTS